MWRILNWLFGWHYVAVSFGGEHAVRKIRVDANGDPYVKLYGKLVHLRNSDRDWVPLTCPTTAITETN